MPRNDSPYFGCGHAKEGNTYSAKTGKTQCVICQRARTKSYYAKLTLEEKRDQQSIRKIKRLS